MSIEDLKEQNILLPEEQWGIHNLKTTVAQVPVLVLFFCAVGGCFLSYFGEGERLTWVGIILFFFSFFGIILFCDRAIAKQRERTREDVEEFKESE